MIERVTYTTQPSAQSMGRYITVYAPDGSYVSRHINMEECTESALAHAQANEISGTYRFVPPEKHMSVQIIKTVPGVFTGSYIAVPIYGSANAVGYAGVVDNVNPGPPGSEPWDIWGARSQPTELDSFSFPATPTTSSAVNVSSIADLNSNIANGVEVTLAPGSYSGNVNVSASNCVINLTGCTISGNLTFGSVSSVRLNGGGFTSSTTDTTWNNLTDVHFDNVRITYTALNGQTTMNSITRLLWTNCTFQWTQGRGFILRHEFSVPSDVAVCGAEIIVEPVNGWGLRVNGCNRLIVVDSRLRLTGAGSPIRAHNTNVAYAASIDGCYIARNQFEQEDSSQDCFTHFTPFGATGQTPGALDDGFIYDNSFYDIGSNTTTTIALRLFQGAGGSMDNWDVADNTHYTNRNGGSGSMVIGGNTGAITNYSASNNVMSPVIVPPSFAYGSNQ